MAGEFLDSLLVKVDEVKRNKPKNVSMQEHIATNLTAEEVQDYRTAQSEIAAIAAENVLGNEAFIKKLFRKDTNIAQKVLNRIMDMKEAFTSLKSKDARSAYTYLQKAEKLYLKAIEEVGAKFQKRRIIGIKRLEEGEEIDDAPQIVYNEGQEALQHSRKDSLINRTFPTYKESAGSEANTLATRWAHRADIQAGDKTLISYHDSWQKFDDSDLGYQIMERIAQKDYDKIAEDIKRNGASGRIQSIQRAFTDFAQFDKQRDSARRAESSPHSLQVEHGGENSKVLRDSKTATQRGQTQNDGGGDSKSRRSSKQGLKFSLKHNIEEDVIKQYGKTYRWSETGYLLKDGSRVDMSGRNDGAPGGYRTIDHRDIFYDITGDYGTDAMVEFMSRGNIRVMPETPGINLQVEPTAEQYRLIQDMVEKLGWKQEYFSVDFDNANGDTVDSLTYEGKVSARKVVADIRYYFKEGKIPYQSELSQFRYSLIERKVASYINNELDVPTLSHIRSELSKIYGEIDNAIADGIAIEHGSDVYIVDSGRENGSTTFGIRRRRRISDARLRAEFIRSTNNDAISKWFVSDEIPSRGWSGLGDDSGRNMRRESRTKLQTDSRESSNNKGGVLEKDETNRDGRLKFSLKEDSTVKQLSEWQKEFFKDSKVVDEQGRLLVVYHGTKSDFTVFDRTKGGESNSIADVGFWFVADEQGALNWANNSWWGDSEKGKAMPVYLKMDNPKIYESTNNNTDSLIEKARELNRERAKIANMYLYDIDRVNGITGVSEWDAFRMLVEIILKARSIFSIKSAKKRDKKF